MHTKVEVRVAHLLGMHSLDDFRVCGLEVRTALILDMYSFDDFRAGPWALRGPGALGRPSTPKSKLRLHTS